MQSNYIKISVYFFIYYYKYKKIIANKAKLSKIKNNLYT